MLILLEVQCLAGLLPHPTGNGPREALQPAIAGMVRWRVDDDATPLLTPGAHGCRLVLSPEVRSEVVLRLQPFGEATVRTWEAYLSPPTLSLTLETGSGSRAGNGSHPVTFRCDFLSVHSGSPIAQRCWDRLEPVPSTPYTIHTKQTVH